MELPALEWVDLALDLRPADAELAPPWGLKDEADPLPVDMDGLIPWLVAAEAMETWSWLLMIPGSNSDY